MSNSIHFYYIISCSDPNQWLSWLCLILSFPYICCVPAQPGAVHFSGFTLNRLSFMCAVQWCDVHLVYCTLWQLSLITVVINQIVSLFTFLRRLTASTMIAGKSLFFLWRAGNIHLQTSSLASRSESAGSPYDVTGYSGTLV